MPRIRTIKPQFFTDETIADLPPFARLLFVGLWTIADKEGRLDDRPRRIKVEVLPYDDCDVDALLSLLAEHRFIVRYTVNGSNYIQIRTFTDHQHCHPKETESSIPPVPDIAEPVAKQDLGMVEQVAEHNLGTPQAIPSNLPARQEGDFRKEISGRRFQEGEHKPNARARARGGGSEPVREVFDYWREKTKHPEAKLTDKRENRVKARLKEGYEVEKLKLAVDGNLLSPHHQGQNDKGIVWDDLELICRSGERVEFFLNLAMGNGVRGSPEGLEKFAQTRNTANNAKVIEGWVQKGASE